MVRWVLMTEIALKAMAAKNSSTMIKNATVKFSGHFTIYFAMSKPFAVVITHDVSRPTVKPSFFFHSKPVSVTLYMTVVVAG